MGINVKWAPPPSMLATAAMQGGFLQGDVERRRFATQTQQRQQQLGLQARQMQVQAVQRQQALRQRMIEGLLQQNQANQRFNAQQTNREFMANMGAEEELAAAMDEQVEAGMMKYPPDIELKMRQNEGDVAEIRRLFAEGEMDEQAFRLAMNKKAGLQRMYRQSAIPTRPDERPPKAMYYPQEGEPFEIPKDGVHETPDGSLLSVETDRQGNVTTRMLRAGDKNPKFLRELANIEAEADAKEKAEKLEVLSFEKEMLPAWEDEVERIEAANKERLAEYAEELKEWEEARTAAIELEVGRAEETYADRGIADKKGEVKALPAAQAFEAKDRGKSKFERLNPKPPPPASLPQSLRPRHPSLVPEGEGVPAGAPAPAPGQGLGLKDLGPEHVGWTVVIEGRKMVFEGITSSGQLHFSNRETGDDRYIDRGG